MGNTADNSMSAHQDSAEIKLTLETILLNMQEGNAVIDVRSIKATLRHLSTLREQRDELLEALERAERCLERMGCSGIEEPRKSARAAIAKARSTNTEGE